MHDHHHHHGDGLHATATLEELGEDTSKKVSYDPYVSLHVHSEHSFLDGVPTVKELFDRVEELDQAAVAMTDHGDCSGHIRAARESYKRGIKFIPGMEGYFTDNMKAREGRKGEFSDHLLLLAKDNTGLQNLWRLSSLGYLEGMYYDPRVDWDTLDKYKEGLITTTGCLGGIVSKFLNPSGKYYNPDKAMERISRFQKMFGEDFYVELHTFNGEEQFEVNKILVELASGLGLPCIIVSDSHYLRPEDWLDHEQVTAAQMQLYYDSPERFQYGPDQLRLFSSDEVKKRMDYLPSGVVEEAIKNTKKIADECGVVIKESRDMPVFFDSVDLDVRRLKTLAKEGFERKIPRARPSHIPLEEYEKRLEYEMEIIISKGYAGYFLFVHQMIEWAKEQGQLVGPARGSAGGSLLSYVLDITEIDPLRADLIFERFLDPGRDTLPDIDIDFPRSERHKVREFLEDYYGKESIATLGTFITLAPRMLLRDFCRVLRVDYMDTNRMSKIIEQVKDIDTANVDVSWSTVLNEKGGDLQEWVQKYPRLFELMEKFHGHVRHAGGHAAGVVISKQSLLDKVPLRVKDGDVRTQMEAPDVEYLGLVKIDMLGLRTLSTLMAARDLALKNGKEFPHFYEWQYDWDRFYQDDAVFESLWDGKNIGCFQIETSGLRSLTKRYKPSTLEELTDIISVFRPGTTRTTDSETGLNMLEYFLKKKAGELPVKLKHPLLEDILGSTFGNITYQEQVMKICNVLAGYSLSETDRVRKILGKMMRDKMDEERDIFVSRAIEYQPFLDGCNGQDPKKLANSIFDDFAEAGTYIYNKAHGYAYAMVGYWCAWTKHYFPSEFMTALFQTNPDESVQYTREARRLGIQVLGPDINQSGPDFTLVDEHTIRYGMSSVKYVASAAGLLAESGPYQTMKEFVERIPKRAFNKRAAESAIRVGALNSLVDREKNYDRDHSLEWNALYQYWKTRGDGPKDSPSDVNENLSEFEVYAAKLGVEDKYSSEVELLGLSVTVDPLEDYFDLLVSQIHYPGEDEMFPGEKCTVGGLISQVRPLVTKSGRNPGSRMCQMWVEMPKLDSESEGEGAVQIVVFPECFAKYEKKIEVGTPVLVKAEKLGGGGISANMIIRLDRDL